MGLALPWFFFFTFFMLFVQCLPILGLAAIEVATIFTFKAFIFFTFSFYLFSFVLPPVPTFIFSFSFLIVSSSKLLCFFYPFIFSIFLIESSFLITLFFVLIWWYFNYQFSYLDICIYRNFFYIKKTSFDWVSKQIKLYKTLNFKDIRLFHWLLANFYTSQSMLSLRPRPVTAEHL